MAVDIIDHAWITLVQAKTHILGSTGSTGSTTNNDEISTLINGVTDYIERQAGGRRFLASTGGDTTEIQDGGNGYKTRILLKNYPVKSTGITSIHYNNGDFETANWVAFQATDWTLYGSGGTVKMPTGVPGGSNNIRVIYTGGYESATGSVYPIPQDLVLLALNLVGKQFNKRMGQGKSKEEIGTAKITWATEMDSEDLKTISSYRRINIA